MDDSILAGLSLQEEQRCAAFAAGGDIAVLAGAGCGKTTTLVARYLYLLACGLAPDEIVAITFTERAGREMRARIRARLRSWLASGWAGREQWLERYVALDAAPIGTIHSFCAGLLRAHPAEVGLDPDVAVLDEGQAGLLMHDAVERSLVWATQSEAALPCFELFGPEGLRNLLTHLLARRLEVGPALAANPTQVAERWQAAPAQWLASVLADGAWEECLATLEASEPAQPGDALDHVRRSAIAAVEEARRLAATGEWQAAVRALGEGVRRPGNVGSRTGWGNRAGEVRAALRRLAELYDSQVVRVMGKGDPALDAELLGAWPGLAAAWGQAVAEYQALKEQRRAADFDDLEEGALRLLREHPEVAAYHRSRWKAVLVDEFQDTNDRQRELIEALLGAPVGMAGRLFVVGDAKQSIYRFRGADVTVFRQVEQEIRRAGGQVVQLSRTWRSHGALVELLNELLAKVLGAADDPARPYVVPFAPLEPASNRSARLRPPFVELHVGVAQHAEDGRQAAATALARRLAELHREEGLGWGEVACLFRATAQFPAYEEAFEQAHIPYVTVAGAGFYDRPEVRDLLNALRALAHPTDDLAMAGLLRSPAIGLADPSLYLLRWGADGRPHPFWDALRGDLSALDPDERARARRAMELVAELHPQVGRQPAAMILKRFLDRTAYLALLRLAPGGERARRNVDKLLGDAHRSGLVGVDDLLEYVQALRDVGAREGEAPPEAGEAVQLMSVHKAKGLEFSVVVIADAGHGDPTHMPPAFLHPEWGLVLRVTRAEGAEKREGLLHGLACREEEALQDAEERRLLYVAATRAKEKLLVSGHARLGRDGLLWSGWLKRLVLALGQGEPLRAATPEVGAQVGLSLWQGRVLCTLYGPLPGSEPAGALAERAVAAPRAGAAGPLATLAPLAGPWGASRPPSAVKGGRRTPERVWRVVPRKRELRAPSWLVGKLVHLGLRLWRFPGDAGLAEALEAAARDAGLTDLGQIAGAVAEAEKLLGRFRRSQLWPELAAAPRRHEVPFVATAEDPWGSIDILALRPDGNWWLVDFKTDEVRTPAQLRARVAEYAPQLQRYGCAVAALLGKPPLLLLCFLDCQGSVRVQDIGMVPSHHDRAWNA